MDSQKEYNTIGIHVIDTYWIDSKAFVMVGMNVSE